ncbi:MAG: M23 family metallopeptidase, partial [Methylovirgula sp.]
MLSRRTPTGTRPSRFQLQLTLHTGPRSRTLVLPPVALTILAGILPLAGLLFLAAACYFIFHDDLLASLTRRQIATQYSYEDRLARLRHEILNLTQRAKINEANLGEKLDALARQQGQLETRTILIAALAQRVKALHGSAGREAAEAARPELTASVNPLLSGAFAPNLPPGASAYISLDSFAGAAPHHRSALEEPKPQPDGFELRLTNGVERSPHADTPAADTSVRSGAGPPAISPLSFDPDLPLSTRIEHLAARQQRLDHVQLALLDGFQQPAKRMAARIRAAFRSAGLVPDQLRPPPRSKYEKAMDVGGPFVPLPTNSPDAAAFARAATDAQGAIATAEKLRRIAAYVPLAAPLPGRLEVTSPFGPRIDPFLGRPALHTGVDLRDDYGAPVRATADGTVILASADGGYGNLVEIDHGNGLSTRYAHLSSFAVRPGQKIKAGT